MKLDSISCNNAITSRSHKLATNPKRKVSTINTNSASKSGAADSVLLLFAGFLDILGFRRPLYNLISVLKDEQIQRDRNDIEWGVL